MPSLPPRPSPARVAALTALAMLAFAANSLLCRLALQRGAIDAASFTSIRLLAGAIVLWLALRVQSGSGHTAGDWPSAVALFAYAAGFSFAYLSLPAGTGALLLFGAVQVTMIGHGLWHGERLRAAQTAGFVAACGGLVAMLLPGVHAPPWQGALLMLGAGVAWGIYSLRGRGTANPLAMTAGNFGRAGALTLVMSLALVPVLVPVRTAALDATGIACAIASGALASGAGYAVWYAALRGLTATRAAAVQLTVPVIAALGAVAFLGETITLRLALTSVVVLGGVAFVIGARAAPMGRG
ncbi:MAG: DMT family transporter [Burkholderiales bacterium]